MKITNEINKYIFRGYDIRGIADKDLTDDAVYTIGKAFGSKLIDDGNTNCFIGRDNRNSSPRLREALVNGILDSGVSVIDLGLCTTPMYYYACILKNVPSGIMITASHNPKDDNGFKFAFNDKGNACGKEIEDFRDYVLAGKFHDGKGDLSYYNIVNEYYDLMTWSINLGPRRVKAVIDCGNGTTSLFAKTLYNKFNIDAVMLYDESDGNFPNHIPDPAVEDYMADLKKKVISEHADVGLAFDGDGDRIGIISNTGKYIPADIYMLLMARDVLPKNNNKKVLFDVKCSKALSDEITKLGGTYECYRSGNSYTRRETREGNCILGVELSGHVYFRDKFLGFDSGMYAGLRMIELLSNTDKTVDELLEGINKYYSTPEIKVPTPDEIKFKVVDKVKEYAISKNYQINDIDGVRVEFADGWALVRASNTGPNITLRFEGKTEAYRDQLQKEFTDVLEKTKTSL